MLKHHARPNHRMGASPVQRLVEHTLRDSIVARDGELIRVCGHLAALNRQIDALCKMRRTFEEEKRTDGQISTLFDQKREIVDALGLLVPPKSLAGLQALSSASLADHWHRNSENDCDGHWMAIVVLERLAEGLDGLDLDNPMRR